MPSVADAKRRLSMALDMVDKYEFGTIGHRQAVERDIPNAIERLIEAKFEALTQQLPDVTSDG